jgi:hypothetical protein
MALEGDGRAHGLALAGDGACGWGFERFLEAMATHTMRRAWRPTLAADFPPVQCVRSIVRKDGVKRQVVARVPAHHSP